MAAKVNEHLTRLIRRDRAESLVTGDPALRLLLTAARRQSRRNRTVCSPTQGSLRSIQRTRRPPASEAASRHSPRGGPLTHATTERHTKANSPTSDPHPLPASRELPAEGQPAHPTATTTTPPETPTTTLHYLTKHGEEPSTQSRPPPGRPDQASHSEPPGPAGWGTTMQHSL